MRDARWFANVGKPAQGRIVLTSWADAIAQSVSDHWESILIEGVNDIFWHIEQNNSNRGHHCNDANARISVFAEPLVGARVKDIPFSLTNKPEVTTRLRSIVVMSCVRLEFPDIALPKFYQDLADLLIAGRFPCGYTGEYPEGQVVIY